MFLAEYIYFLMKSTKKKSCICMFSITVRAIYYEISFYFNITEYIHLLVFIIVWYTSVKTNIKTILI